MTDNWSSNSSVAGSGFNDCLVCGASVAWKNQTQHINFHKTFSNRIGDDMSRVSWCDYGDHSFKRGVEGSASFSGTEFDSAGRPIETQMDACPEHNPLNVQREAAKYQLTTRDYVKLNGEALKEAE